MHVLVWPRNAEWHEPVHIRHEVAPLTLTCNLKVRGDWGLRDGGEDLLGGLEIPSASANWWHIGSDTDSPVSCLDRSA